MRRASAVRLAAVAALVAGAAVTPLRADPPPRPAEAAKSARDSIADAGRQAGEAGREVGRSVGQAGREVGRDVAQAAKKLWREGKSTGKPLLDDVRDATRDFWARLAQSKDETIAALKRENAELKEKLARRGAKP